MSGHSDGEALSAESSGLAFGEVIRDYVPNPAASWRSGRPDFLQVNRTFFEHRSLEHEVGSLEAVVSKLIKNWAVETHHVADVHLWKTMDISKFQAAVNGGCPVLSQQMADMGACNLFLGESETYNCRLHSFESMQKVFRAAFPMGFAWECLEVFSGPPTVVFKWRHFGKYTGVFTAKSGKKYKGNGQMLSIVGMCIAKVDTKLMLTGFDVYYNPEELTELLTTMVDANWRPLGDEEADGTSQGGGCRNNSCVLM
ncbi:unnamed protein product [Effrenium voratum]|uniref:Pathogen-related protein n=1 Tax=Effrenium voratum TaxID=2562239 RepID=A0AA36J261_9DINO|nr:unnamed protein product [Effrenium voratum]CAJ1423873.1 unnamed protein product [Effrenium voratum]